MCWRRYTIDLALDAQGISLSDRMSEALDDFENVIASTDRMIDFLMQEGELLFVDNKRTVHARTPIAEGANSHRLIIRSWIQAA
jgi:alpha-ketoglutarate-dependent taurine dioxygenase